MSIIQEKITVGTLTAWYAMKAGHVDDLSTTGANASFNGAPVFNRDGLQLDGSNDYLSATGTGIFNTINTTIVVEFTPDFDTDEDAFRYLCSTTASEDYIINKNNNAGSNTLRIVLGGTVIDSIAEGVYSPFWNAGERNVLVVSGTTGANNAWLNGNQILTADNTAWTPDDPASLLIGAASGGSSQMDGSIGNFLVFSELFDATEVARIDGELANLKWPTKTEAKALVNVSANLNDPSLVWNGAMKPVDNKIIDNSPTGQDCTIVGAWHKRSPLGDSMSFNGTDTEISLGTALNSTITKSGTFTTEVWFKANSITAGEQIFNSSVASADRHGITLVTNGVAGQLFNGSTYESVSESIIAGVWNHFVYTNNNETKTAYLNGIAVTGSVTSNTLGAATTTRIGANTSLVAGRYFDGDVAHVAVYSEIKDATWVLAQYEKGANAVQYKTDYGVNESVANVTAGELENTGWTVNSGTWKVSTDTINGQKVKVFECVVGGVISIPVDQFMTPTEVSYGSWEWWLYPTGNFSTVLIMADVAGNPSATGQDAYWYDISGTGQVRFGESVNGTPALRMTSATGYIANDVWHKMGITRTGEGVFTMKVDDVLVDVTGGSGTNPTTDATITSSRYLVMDLDAGDKVAISAVDGNNSFNKKLGAV